jgi:phosphoglycolate phosphatase-like HAD superfamily hydrolase
MTGVVLDLDGALGDTRPLWDDWLRDAHGVLGLDPGGLPADRAEAAAVLDAVAGNWRALLERYAEDRAPVYLRPSADASAALRRLAASGTRVVVVTDAPEELARVALGQLGAARRIEALEIGGGAIERARDRLGPDARVVRTRAELVALGQARGPSGAALGGKCTGSG